LNTDKLIRWAGLATILGSACLMFFPILHPNHDPEGYQSARWIPVHLMLHLAAITFLFGLPAIFARQGERNGRLGLAGYILATVATAQLLMVAWVELFIIPFLGLRMPELENTPPPGVEIAGPLMNLSLAVGYAVLGAGIMRARVLPRGAGLMLLIAAPIFGAGDLVLRLLMPETTLDLFVFSMALFSISMGWVGLALWTGRGERRPIVASARSSKNMQRVSVAVPAKS
jgi:hypothetical protein